MNEFVYILGMRSEHFESYYFQASDGGMICAEMKHGISVLKILKDGSWISEYPGVDFDVYDFAELIGRGRVCLRLS